MVFDSLKKITEKMIGTKHISYSADKEANDDYVEVNVNNKENKNKILIKYFILEDYNDMKPILDYIREGNSIILANIKPLKSKDMSDLKRAISKIKKTCEAVGGDIVGIDEYFILIYPDYAEISKEDFE